MPVATLRQSHGYFEGVPRLRLHYHAWETDAAGAVLLVVHGLGEHAGRYAALAAALADAGVSTFALDLRGHGRSEGRRGHAARFDLLLQDLDRFRREVQGLVGPRRPLFLLGHSFGGLVALRYLQEFQAPFRGAALVSPWLATAVPVPRWKAALAGALERVLPAVPFSARIAADLLSRDPAVVRAYREDPLVHDTITPRLFSELSAAIGLALRRADRLHVPLLFLLAGDDRLIDTRRTLSLTSALPPDAEVAVRVFPAYYHEVLNDLGREEALAELRRWLARRLG